MAFKKLHIVIFRSTLNLLHVYSSSGSFLSLITDLQYGRTEGGGEGGGEGEGRGERGGGGDRGGDEEEGTEGDVGAMGQRQGRGADKGAGAGARGFWFIILRVSSFSLFFLP